MGKSRNHNRFDDDFDEGYEDVFEQRRLEREKRRLEKEADLNLPDPKLNVPEE